MKLEELRAELETQATEDMKVMEKKMFNMEREVEIRKKECLDLRARNDVLNKHINHIPPTTVVPTDEKIAEVIAALSHRCYALSQGTMCGMCMIQEFCQVKAVKSLRILLDRIGMPGKENL